MKTAQEMLTGLRTNGWSDAEMAAELSTPAPTIFRLRKGIHQRTNYERYAAIESLFHRVTKGEPA